MMNKQTKDELIHTIRNNREAATRESARAQLDAVMLAELMSELRAASSLIYDGMGVLAEGIKRHREQLALAASSTDRSAIQMAFLTKVLIGTNIGIDRDKHRLCPADRRNSLGYVGKVLTAARDGVSLSAELPIEPPCWLSDSRWQASASDTSESCRDDAA